MSRVLLGSERRVTAKPPTSAQRNFPAWRSLTSRTRACSRRVTKKVFHKLTLLDPCREALLDLVLACLRVAAAKVLPHHVLRRLTEIERAFLGSGEDLRIANRLHTLHSTMVPPRTCARLPRREPHSSGQSGPRGGHGVLPAVSADARQARSADPSQGGRGGLLPRRPEPRLRPRPAGRAQGRGPRLPGVPVRAGQQHDRDDRRRLAHGLLRQALHLLAGRRSVRPAVRRQRHAVLQHADDHGDGLDGLSLPAEVQPARGSRRSSRPRSSC